MKNTLMDFMKWMAINDKKPWENYELVVNEYLNQNLLNNDLNCNNCGSPFLKECNGILICLECHSSRFKEL